MANTDPRATLIEAALQRHSLSYRWLGERLGVTHKAVSAWLRGDSKPRDAGVWNKMLAYLQQYETALRQTPEDISVRRVGIRQVPIMPGLSAGGMGSAYADVTMMDFKDWGTDRERWGRVIEGYSMSPLLEPGDIVIFENRNWEPWHVVQAFDNGEDTVKVIRKNPLGDFELVPVNPEYPVIDGKGKSIKGVAIMRIRKLPAGETQTAEYDHGLRYRIDDSR